MILSAAASIEIHKQQINELNVFPVPDGDTGTNMSMTLNAAAADLRKAGSVTLTKAADITASAMLRGARGNSGVILSLLFRGFSKALKGVEACTGEQLAQALRGGVEAAYKAVMKPTEGTILTVARVSADTAMETADSGADCEAVLEATVRSAAEALAQTVNQNPVLQKAGVVDAGGKGWLYVLEAMLSVHRGVEIEAPEADSQPQEVREQADFTEFDTGEITFAFDTVYIMRKAHEDIDLSPLRAYLDTIGDSIVIGEDDESFKVHVHTNIPGEALTESQKYGTLELAKIENMRTQAEDLAAGRKAQSTDDLEEDGHDHAAPAPQPQAQPAPAASDPRAMANAVQAAITGQQDIPPQSAYEPEQATAAFEPQGSSYADDDEDAEAERVRRYAPKGRLFDDDEDDDEGTQMYDTDDLDYDDEDNGYDKKSKKRGRYADDDETSEDDVMAERIIHLAPPITAIACALIVALSLVYHFVLA